MGVSEKDRPLANCGADALLLFVKCQQCIIGSWFFKISEFKQIFFGQCHAHQCDMNFNRGAASERKKNKGLQKRCFVMRPKHLLQCTLAQTYVNVEFQAVLVLGFLSEIQFICCCFLAEAIRCLVYIARTLFSFTFSVNSVIKEGRIYIALLLCTVEHPKSFTIISQVFPHPPLVCSTHVDDATAATVQQRQRSPHTGYRWSRVHSFQYRKGTLV